MAYFRKEENTEECASLRKVERSVHRPGCLYLVTLFLEGYAYTGNSTACLGLGVDDTIRDREWGGLHSVTCHFSSCKVIP